MIERLVKTSQGNEHWIRSSDADVVAWFEYSENCTDIILKQINEDQIYGPILAGRTDMTIVDMGANIGLFSLYAHDCASKLISVEPAPRTFEMLTKLTQDIPVIERIEGAISYSDQPVTFFMNENSTVNSLLDRNGQATTVRGMSLASFFKNNKLDHVDFCKCDIEGSESEVLTEDNLDSVKDVVKFWFIEVHQTDVKQLPWPGNLGANRDRIGSIMRNMGYSTEQVINDQLFAWR